ncbi:helix-turn-helix transcriptional regulator [Dyadobacter chenwenxiniae]|uniref:Helix-turn-helix transcriptional regulator n=1 Tax=Dyadobacter chenwenxiniae TaxID=2906456 RepID=A0A9X1PUS2_9BACT|nr:helix-turn-helix transcriptional regulator [Dyadobacter chenwenxiniae]MCF0065541.1 helix-turn-helix transcriptional regulator [Dyadobacter chenwenxiniae]UON85451.1 helix-turn-helix transcriptional regulator [Dyadobacter chenwenxiniae]
MKPEKKGMMTFNSIPEFHKILGTAEPGHPLVSVINFQDLGDFATEISEKAIYNFYMILLVKRFDGRIRYGQNYVDFDAGQISFFSPGQILSTNANAKEGWILLIHPDFIRDHPFGKIIKNFGFFSYEIYEALFLSEKEESLLDAVADSIAQECRVNTDQFSQKIIIALIEVLLNHADRFYNRQFITRKHLNNDLLARLEGILTEYFDSDKVSEEGLPSVEDIAAQLFVSPHYLSDMLKSLTGLNTQQHIQNKLIEKAKENLAATTLSVGEIAYQLGFSHSQSFNRFFKTKTDLSPLAYRRSFN